MLRENAEWFSVWNRTADGLPVRVLPAQTAANSPVEAFLPPPWIVEFPSRRDLWTAALRMWFERPLIGVGPDNFRKTYGTYLGLEPFDKRVYANSLYLETLATTGALGGLALGGLVLAIVVTAWRGWRATTDRRVRVLILGGLLALSSFFIHGLADYFLAFTPTYALFWGLLGATTGLLSSRESA
jgi:O-antigen ligase